MALVKCPECEREISDKAPVCPHCGFPITKRLDIKDQPQKVELSSVNIENKFLTKKRMGLVIGFVFVALVAFFFVNFINTQKEKITKNEYIDNLVAISEAMLEAGIDAEHLTNLTARVWQDSIYEERNPDTKKYTTNESGVFYNDFNFALNDLYSSPETINIVSDLEKSQETVQNMLKQLTNPPAGLEDSYDALIDLNTAYKSLTNLAISPKGSLNSFAESKNAKIDTFLENYNKLDSLIPEKEEVPEFLTSLLGK